LELSDWISNLRTVFELLKVGNENISLSKVASRAFLLFVHLDACPAARCSASWQNLAKVKIGSKSRTAVSLYLLHLLLQTKLRRNQRELLLLAAQKPSKT
jgi:hypothetical protein